MTSRTSAPRDAAARLLGSLGLAARAGRLSVGWEAVRRSVDEGRAAVVLVADDAPQRLRARLQRLASGSGLQKIVALDGDRLGAAIGRPRAVVLAITDRSMGQRVLELAREVEGYRRG